MKKEDDNNQQKIYKNSFLLIFLFLINLFLPNLLLIVNLKLNIVVKFLIEILCTFLTILLYKDVFKEHGNKVLKNPKKLIKYIFLYFIIAFVLNGIINILILNFTSSTLPNNIMLEEFKGTSYIFFLISILITSPIFETTVLFGAISKIYKNKLIVSILISSILYGLFYVVFSFTDISQLLYIISYSVFAAIVAYGYHKTQNIYVPIGIKVIQGLILLVSFI